MEPETAIREKWKLTQQAFDKLLAALAFDRDESAEKYLNLRKNLIRFFESRGVSAAEEAADEVLNRLACKLDGGEIFENISTYALGIARLVSLEIRKSPDQKTSNELPEISVSPFDRDAEEREEKLKCLEKCLGELSAENHQIIVGYYRGERREKIENRQKLADDLGIPNSALRSRAVRLREKLERCITDCLKERKF